MNFISKSQEKPKWFHELNWPLKNATICLVFAASLSNWSSPNKALDNCLWVSDLVGVPIKVIDKAVWRLKGEITIFPSLRAANFGNKSWLNWFKPFDKVIYPSSVTKGQLISKGLFGVFNSCRIRNRTYMPKVKMFSFFERIEDTKNWNWN